MDEENQIREIAIGLGLTETHDNTSVTREWLAKQVNDLLDRDFPRLISILYRVDVSESKLRELLNLHPDTDAGLIIADLLIARQTEKIKSKEKNKPRGNESIDENDRW